MKKIGLPVIYVFLVSALVFTSCSIKKMAMKAVANTLTTPEGGTVFTGDNDPEFVGDALPFAIKMYESLMVTIPQHKGLRLRTGSLYIMYANAFLQTPASLLSAKEYKKQDFLMKRAKNLYLRGRDIVMTALEQVYPGFIDNLNSRKYDKALAPVQKPDVPFLYWAAAGWLGAFAIDPFDMKLGLTVPRAAAMMDYALRLDENFQDGAIHEFYVLYYGSMPEYMGGNFKKARQHFKKAVGLSKGKSTSAYISLATTVSIQEQNLDEFKELLDQVLKIDSNSDPDNRLVNILNQRKARWLLDHVEDFFLLADDSQTTDSEDAPRDEEEF
ncbi:MAG: TRAP transporter TatT component family protein [Candidatus Aminicenantes bacterium]|nr:TRAP transporter TatT component family protein [Candidatus Aminicenantes bacterium]